MKTYSIGEVARLLGVKPYIIRYWESELPLLAPRKSPSGRRAYSSGEVRLLLRFKHLLYGRKFTVEGAKRRMWEELGGSIPEAHLKIAQIREELIDLLMLVQGRKGGEMTESKLIEKLTALGQGHLFARWDSRPPEMKRRLLEDLELLDITVVETLKLKLTGKEVVQTGGIQPAPYVRRAEAHSDAQARALGEELVRRGATALLTVAGGQGSRLGFDGPKGMFPISPIRSLTLFAIFAEKLSAARRRYGCQIPWYIMTSPQNHDATRAYFEDQDYFGLGRDSIRFFTQGLLPSLSPSGGMLMATDGGLLFNPNGHGGVIEALRSSGLLDEVKVKGVEELFYFQIDNPLVTVPDPVFLGLHRRAGSQISSKVIEKAFAEEKLGTIAILDGKPAVIEYSDLKPELMHARDPEGRLVFPQGSIAIHILNVAYLASGRLQLPYHLARKKVSALNPDAGTAETEEREAIKFEMFIFDAIPLADRTLFLETDRDEEFSPLKNREGVDSIETCRDGQTKKFARWLETIGVDVPRTEQGRSRFSVEISPLFALDREELASKRSALKKRIDGDLLLA
jgi:UDP-N-acetylglucosamine/UDP-N-acetylgalactosamine diphosphorylase